MNIVIFVSISYPYVKFEDRVPNKQCNYNECNRRKTGKEQYQFLITGQLNNWILVFLLNVGCVLYNLHRHKFCYSIPRPFRYGIIHPPQSVKSNSSRLLPPMDCGAWEFSVTRPSPDKVVSSANTSSEFLSDTPAYSQLLQTRKINPALFTQPSAPFLFTQIRFISYIDWYKGMKLTFVSVQKPALNNCLRQFYQILKFQ